MLEADLGVEILDLRRNQDLEIIEWKPAKLRDAALTRAHAIPHLRDRGPDGRHSAKPGYHDTTCAARFGHTLLHSCSES